MTKLPQWFQVSLLLMFFVSIPLKVISQNITSQEQATLMEIKQQLGNPGTLSHWNNSSSPCDWPEIGCTDNSVTAILLKEKNILTPTPSSICDLKNLLAVQLSNNSIPGEFPKVLYNCSKLVYLDLSQNYFVGAIPDDIDRMSTLTYLDLSGNNFTGNIPDAIGKLLDLQTLYIHQNEFNGTFPKEIGNLANLEILALAYNGFSPMSIPEEFGNLRKLTYLWMKDANLIGKIPESLNNLTSLQHLDLAINRLEGPIPSKLFTFENLTELYLFSNKLSGEIPRPVTALSLSEIDLSMNEFSGSIPEDFGKLQSLEVLNLFTNRLTGEIPASIGQLPNLSNFRVFTNKLSGSLPPDLGSNMKLEAFEASNNMFSGKLPENLCKGGVLLGVVVFSNNLSGHIPKSLGDCRTLRTVQLYSNKFEGEIPPGLWTNVDLSTMKISDNLFSGQLPVKVASNLSRLEMNNNRFNGQIPDEISSWKSLVVFEASGNQFSGKIPAQLTNLSKINSILLDRNQLSGELPSIIISWKALTALNFSRNNISGQIPASFGSLTDLAYLDLSHNHLTGKIPFEIGNLNAPSLDLSSNQLSGEIPTKFNNLAYANSFKNNSNLCADNPAIDLPDCYKRQTNSKKLSTKVLAVILSLAVLLFLGAVVCFFIIVRDYRRRKYGGGDIITWKLTAFHDLRFNESIILSSLTESNLIGSGGSGKVYRIPINRVYNFVAVKKIWNSKKLDSKLEKQFLAEVQILGTIRHSNIVKLLCCISSEDSKLLVYEYMENQSLDRWLHQKTGSNSVPDYRLDWPKRLQIAIGAAQGLCYMHHDCSPPILHRDVKSSNILLDEEFKAKIADFGLAQMLAKDREANAISGIVGSFGYIAPEHAYTAKVNEKIDIYSFGVVLLELATGREPNNNRDSNKSLAEWAWQKYAEETPIIDALDQDIKEPCYLDSMTTVFKLGLICTSKLPNSRPSMKEVVQTLKRCDAPEGYKEKKAGGEFDVAPLLGSTASYLSSYRGSKKNIIEAAGESLVYRV